MFTIILDITPPQMQLLSVTGTKHTSGVQQGHCHTKWRKLVTSRTVLTLKSHEGGSSSCISNIFHCRVVFILDKYITSTFLLLDLSCKSLKGAGRIGAAKDVVRPAGVPVISTVLVVVGVVFWCFLRKNFKPSLLFHLGDHPNHLGQVIYV